SLYLNAEMRVRMKQFQTYLLNGTAGVLLFNDTGRVWLDGENSKKWHNGTGLGLWFSPFDMAVVSVSYAVSADDQLFNFSVNYQFECDEVFMEICPAEASRRGCKGIKVLCDFSVYFFVVAGYFAGDDNVCQPENISDSPCIG